MAKTSKFWAGACAGLTMPFAAVGGALKGGYDALAGNEGARTSSSSVGCGASSARSPAAKSRESAASDARP